MKGLVGEQGDSIALEQHGDNERAFQESKFIPSTFARPGAERHIREGMALGHCFGCEAVWIKDFRMIPHPRVMMHAIKKSNTSAWAGSRYEPN